MAALWCTLQPKAASTEVARALCNALAHPGELIINKCNCWHICFAVHHRLRLVCTEILARGGLRQGLEGLYMSAVA